MLCVLLVAIALPYSASFASALGLVPLTLGQLSTIGAIVALYLVAMETLKHWFYVGWSATRRTTDVKDNYGMSSTGECATIAI